jgi:phosphohistidine phosphatase SixA
MIAASLRDRFVWVLSIAFALLGQTLIACPATASEDAALWRALRSGEHIVLLRHAMAPGTGDPGHFVLGDCSTQRNLSAAGREQASRIGRRLRENGIAAARVHASQWCRALETAELLQLGPVSPLPALNSFFGSRQSGAAQTRTLSEWMRKQDLTKPFVLVTHQVNITALTNVYPASGEMVIVRRTRDGKLRVVGTLQTD